MGILQGNSKSVAIFKLLVQSYYKVECEFSIQEGTYIKSKQNLCGQAEIDPGCAEEGACRVKRSGLCALPPARVARTHLPIGNLNPCTPKSAEDTPFWTYPDYKWTQHGTPGDISVQVRIPFPLWFFHEPIKADVCKDDFFLLDEF